MKKVMLFDTETTGFPVLPVETQAKEDQPRILQIHAVVIEHNMTQHTVIDTFSTLMSGVKHIPKKITEINGISLSDLHGAPTWASIRDRFFGLVENAGCIVAHNLPFDARMVHVEEHMLGFGKPFQNVKRLCSLDMSRKVNTSAPSHNLGKLYKHLFGEEMKNAHTADGDVAGLIRVYMDLVGKGAWGQID